MKNESNRPKGLEFWSAHLARFNKSGLSANEYCRKNGLKNSSFHTHVKRSREPHNNQYEPFLEIKPQQASQEYSIKKPSIDVVIIRIPGETTMSSVSDFIRGIFPC